SRRAGALGHGAPSCGLRARLAGLSATARIGSRKARAASVGGDDAVDSHLGRLEEDPASAAAAAADVRAAVARDVEDAEGSHSDGRTCADLDGAASFAAVGVVAIVAARGAADQRHERRIPVRAAAGGGRRSVVECGALPAGVALLEPSGSRAVEGLGLIAGLSPVEMKS